MKKIFMAVALFVAGVTFANAEDYNRVAVSFDNIHFGLNKNMKAEVGGLYGIKNSFIISCHNNNIRKF